MSSKIDNRVVQMKFDNGQFQKGVAETSGALDRLKTALKMDGVGSSSLSGIGQGVQDLIKNTGLASTAFENFKTIAIGALLATGAQVAQLGHKIVTDLTQNLTSGARDGFKEYETQVNAISTILANTKSKGETLESINGQLDVLNKYSDETIYNFTEMVSGIKTLTAAGVDLEQGVDVVKGFANAAALAGVGAEEMARGMEFGLNQAIQKGYLGIQDFTSIQGVAGEQFKNAMMETARVHGVNVDALIAKNGSFRDSLGEGWATTEIITETLAKFTGELSDEQLRSMGYTDQQIEGIQEMAKTAVASATEVKTWTQLLGTFSEQIGSGWANTWRTVIGDTDQAKKVFTMISTEVGAFIEESNKARQTQVELWAEMGGRDAIVQAIKNAFDALNSVLNPIKEAWAEVFPPSLGKTLAQISFAIRDFTAGLILSEGAQANLKMVAKGLFTVLKFGFDIIGGIIKVIGVFAGFVINLAGAFFSLVEPVLTFVRSLLPVKEGADKATSGVTNFFDMLANAGKFLTGWLPDAIKNLSEMLNNFLNGDGASARIAAFKQNIVGIGQAIQMMWNVLSKGTFTDNPFFSEDSTLVQTLFKIRDAITKVVDAFKALGSGVATAAGNSMNFWQGIGNAIKAVWEFIKPLVDGIKSYFTDITGSLDVNTILATINTGILGALAVGIFNFIKMITDAFKGSVDLLKTLGGVLENLGGVLEAWQTKLKAEAMLKLAAAIVLLAAGLWILSTIDPERLISATIGMAAAFGILLGGMAILDKLNASPSVKASFAIIAVAAAVAIMATAVETMANLDPWALARGLGGIAAAMLVLILGLAALDSVEKDVVKSAFAMMIMASAIQMMALAVLAFGLMPLDVLIKGMISVTVALGLLVGAAVLISKFAPDMVLSAVGLMAMAAALNMLIGPILILGFLPFNVLLQGMLSLGILLVGLVIAAQGLSELGPKMAVAAVGMMAMAAALNMLVAPIIIIGMLPLDVLAQGMIALGLMLMGLVQATNAMTKAMPGAVAMIAVAGALLILSLAMAVMAGLGLDGILVALIGLAGAIIIMAVAAELLTPAVPTMFSMAGALAVFGLAVVAISLSMLIAAVAIAAMGPALMSLTAGIVAFGKESDNIFGAIGPMLALAAALLVFGLAALVAGVGIIVLAAGFILLGVGLTLVAATALIGATALTAFVNMMIKLVQFVPQLLQLALGFGVLGLAIIVLGVGLLAAGVGMIFFATALVMLAALGPALIPLIMSLLDLIPYALTKLGEGIIQFATIIGGAIPLFVEQFTVLVSSLLQAIQTLTPQIIETLLVLLQGLLDAIVNAVPMFVTAAMELAIGMLKGITEKLPDLFDAGGDLVVEIIEGIGEQSGKIVTAAGDTILKFINGLSTYIDNNSGKFIAAGNKLVRSIINGVAQAIESSGNLIRWAGERIGNAVIQGAMNALGINSPSKVFRDKIMGSVFEGIEKGESKNSIKAYRSGSRIGDAVINGTSSALSRMKTEIDTSMDFTPTIQPIMDLSNVHKSAKELDSYLTVPVLDVSGSYTIASNLSLQQQQNQDNQNGTESESPQAGDTYIQNNYSPKSISDAELYRNTKNLISIKKGEGPK